jgi:hypothetical protein
VERHEHGSGEDAGDQESGSPSEGQGQRRYRKAREESGCRDRGLLHPEGKSLAVGAHGLGEQLVDRRLHRTITRTADGEEQRQAPQVVSEDGDAAQRDERHCGRDPHQRDRPGSLGEFAE